MRRPLAFTETFHRPPLRAGGGTRGGAAEEYCRKDASEVATPVRDRPQIDWANSPSPPPPSSLAVARAAVPRHVDPTFRQPAPHRASPLGRTPPVAAAHSPPRRAEVEGDDVDVAEPGAPPPPPPKPAAPSIACSSATTLNPQMHTTSDTTTTPSTADGGGDMVLEGARAALPRKSLSGGASTKTRRAAPRKVTMISVQEAGQLLKASGHTLEDD